MPEWHTFSIIFRVICNFLSASLPTSPFLGFWIVFISLTCLWHSVVLKLPSLGVFLLIHLTLALTKVLVVDILLTLFFNIFRKDENSEIQPLDATLNGGIENTVPILPLFNLSCSCAVVVPNAPREDQETNCNIRRRKERCVTGKRCACKSSGSQRQSPRKQSKRYRCY